MKPRKFANTYEVEAMHALSCDRQHRCITKSSIYEFY